MSNGSPAPDRPWHALFAPLPPEAIPNRRPVAPPEILATPQGSVIAGWEQLTVELSAGPAGLRIAMVLLDGAGQPISASDWVMYCSAVAQDPGAASGPALEYLHESVGGRLEPDGTFRGTRWRSVSVERPGEEARQLESTPSEPSAADVAALKALVAEVVRRAARE